MASRTQLRLGQITGSFGDVEGGIVDNRGAQAGAGNINALTLNSGSLIGVVSELASAVKRIHGGQTFAGALAGEFGQTIKVDTDSSYDLGEDGTAFRKLFVDDIDLNGVGRIDLDADADSSIRASADDVITFEAGGSDVVAVTADGLIPSTADGASLGTAAAEFSDLFLADGGVINLGDDQEVTLTHVADTGVLLNSDNQLQFGDADTYVNQAADGVLQLRSDTTIKSVIGSTDALIINSSGATFGQNVTITGNLDVNGTTTTIDAANLTVEDSIIGLGVSGSDNSFTDVGDRGIVFAKGASASSLLPAFYYSGDDDIFQLGKTATDAASGSFTDPTQGNHVNLRLGSAEFSTANDNIGVKQNGVLEISGSNGLNIFGDAGTLEIRTGGANDIVFKNDANTLLTLDDGFSHSLVGSLTIDGDGSNPGALVLKDADASNQVTLKAPGTVTSNYELLLPAAIGSGTQVLRLNSGATALEFADVSAAGNTAKQVLLIGGTITAGSVLNTNTGTANVFYAGDAINDLSTADTQGKVLDVFVNGQLLVSGSNTEVVTNGTRDYEVASTNELKFAFDLEADDIVQAIKRG
jgi:hypothetical protein